MDTSRRRFIKRVAGSVIAAPYIIPSSVLAVSPNGQVTMGCIGMGKRMNALLNTFKHYARVLAVCDVDTTRRNAGLNSAGGDAKAYSDFRKLIARDDIDTVCISTPDHWHAIPTIAALKAGKDVYCEKPLTHDIQEAIDVMRAVDTHKRVLQTGSQQRSAPEFRTAAELVRNGVIGKVKKVECKFGGPPKKYDLPEEPMEPGLDWDMWCGPAPLKPYNPAVCPRGIAKKFPKWRAYLEYGGGGVCDWGAHHLDIAQWGLGMDESGPVEARPPAQKGETNGATLVYGNGVAVEHVKKGFGVHFKGEDGEVLVNRGQFKFIYKGKKIAEHVKGSRGTSCRSQAMKAEKEFLKDAKVQLIRAKSHADEFLSCVRN
ncbi:MAG: Gfo/Idh/MocA family protein, partial [Planctomycetota bacterium]